MSDQFAAQIRAFADLGAGLAALHGAMVDGGMGREEATRVVSDYMRAMITPKPEASTLPAGLFGRSA